MSDDCKNAERVAGGEQLHAKICECGSVHLSIGPMTLRFSEDSFRRIHAFVNEIAARIARRAASSSEPAVSSLHPRELPSAEG